MVEVFRAEGPDETVLDAHIRGRAPYPNSCTAQRPQHRNTHTHTQTHTHTHALLRKTTAQTAKEGSGSLSALSRRMMSISHVTAADIHTDIYRQTQLPAHVTHNKSCLTYCSELQPRVLLLLPQLNMRPET